MRPPLAALALLLITAPDAVGHGGQYVRPVPLGPLSPITGVTPEDAKRLRESWSRAPGAPLARKSTVARRSDFMLWWRANGASVLHASASASGASENARVTADWEPVDALLADAMLAGDADLADSAVLAQARAAQTDTDAAFLRIWPLVAHPHDSVRRSAILSVGLLGNPRGKPVLATLLDGASRSDQITAGVAAVALGYLSDPSSISELQRVLTRSAKVPLHTGAVLGLGLFQDDREPIVAFLLELLDRKLEPQVRAQIPISLGRLGDAAAPAVPRLRRLTGSVKHKSMRAPSIIALGQLASPDDQETIRVLRSACSRGRPQLHQLALLALGRIAGRVEQHPGIDATHATEVREFLRQEAGRSSSTVAPFAIVAVALSARDVSLDADELGALLGPIRKRLDDKWNDDLRAAAALAVAMLGDQSSTAALRGMLDPKLGSCATVAAAALGVLGDELAVPRLRDLAERPTAAYDLREQAAIALASMNRPLATKALLRAFERANTATEATFLARMLGAVGDDTVVPVLVRYARDDRASALERAFAIVGLGRLLERSPLPWNARLSAGSNFLDPTPLELALLDIF